MKMPFSSPSPPPLPHSLEAIPQVNSAFRTSLLPIPFLLFQPRLLTWFIPSISCPGSCHSPHPGFPDPSLFPIKLFLDGSRLGHATSLLKILSWLLNAHRTASRLPKRPTKSSTIELLQNFQLDLQHHISRSSHSHSYSSLPVRKPPHHGRRKHPASRLQLRQLLLLQEGLPTRASSSFPPPPFPNICR